MSNRKLKCLSLQEKVELIKEVDKGVFKKKDIAAKFGIPANTLSTILKNREKLQDAISQHGSLKNRKRVKTCVYDDVDNAMLKWVSSVRSQNLPLSGPIIRQKAQDFAIKLGHNDFLGSVGWLDKFKSRHGIVYKAVCGERGDADEQVSDDWKKTVLMNLLKKYYPADVFNADETGLFFKCLPNKTLAFKHEKCHGGKRSKERLTVMVASNMAGTEKLPLLVIGKSKNPRCFKGTKSLGVNYTNNKRAWMTSEIFEKWLLDLNRKFAMQKRKVLLFIDNCPAHPKNIQNLTNIELVYFPPNLTSVLQPMDQGIIQNLKQHYRRKILMKVISAMENKQAVQVTILDAVRELSRCWSADVKPQTIANCFRKAGFIKGDETVEDNEIWSETDEIPLGQLKAMWQLVMASDNPGSSEVLDFDDYVSVDADLVTTSHPTDEEIIESVSGMEGPEEEGSSDEDVGHPEDPPASQEVDRSLESLRRYLECKDHVPNHVFNCLSAVESYIEVERFKNKTQSKITDYFKQI